ncbi:MAG: dipeptidase [Solirubrobacterales bacterium]
MSPSPTFPGLTDVHAHPAMNAYLWDRNLRRHYFTSNTFCPIASLTDFKMLEKGGVGVLWSALHVPEPNYFRAPPLWLAAHLTKGGRSLLNESAWECLLEQMRKMERQVDGTAGQFEIARSNADFDRIRGEGRVAIVQTVEGGHALGGPEEEIATRLDRLDLLAERGVASLTLAHLFRNDLAGHVDAIPKEQHKILLWRLDPEVDLHRGLTEKGRQVVERMLERKMIPDVAHCTPKARRDIYELVAGRAPVIASHVGVQTLNGVAYNLDEEGVKAISDSGGVVGVIFMPYWLDSAHPKKGLKAIWGTMKQIHDWSGGNWDHLAIGTDFDGFTDPPDDCDSEAQLPQVRQMLEGKGLSLPEVDAILGGNARRVLRQGWR